MENVSLELSSDLKRFADRRTEQGGFGHVGDYIRELIRLDQRQSAQVLLEAELLKGLASGPSQVMTKSEWDELRKGVDSQSASRKLR